MRNSKNPPKRISNYRSITQQSKNKHHYPHINKQSNASMLMSHQLPHCFSCKIAQTNIFIRQVTLCVHSFRILLYYHSRESSSQKGSEYPTIHPMMHSDMSASCQYEEGWRRMNSCFGLQYLCTVSICLPSVPYFNNLKRK